MARRGVSVPYGASIVSAWYDGRRPALLVDLQFVPTFFTSCSMNASHSSIATRREKSFYGIQLKLLLWGREVVNNNFGDTL